MLRVERLPMLPRVGEVQPGRAPEAAPSPAIARDSLSVSGAAAVRAAAVRRVRARGPQYGPDNFLLGANLPWVSYGNDFGANAWHPGGGLATSPERLARLDATLGKLAGQGVKQVRWFMLCDGRSGIRFGRDGTPLGLDDRVLADIDAALAAARKHGVKIMFTLTDFGLLKKGDTVSGVQMGGHADAIRNPRKRQALLDKVITPILQRYGRDPNIQAWDIINEPEWVTRWVASVDPFHSASKASMRDFIRQAAALVHRHTTHQATVGSASTRWLGMVKDLGLDFYQAHWYDHFGPLAPLDRPVADLQLDRPLILGEFPTRGTRKETRDILDTVQAAGYGGAMPWSVLATDDKSGYDGAAGQVTGWAKDHSEQLHRQ